MDVERPVLPCIWLPVYVESNRSRILLNGTTFGPKQPVFRVRARMRMAKFGSGCSPLRRGKTKSSAASPRKFRNGTGWGRNPSSLTGAAERHRRSGRKSAEFSSNRDQWARLVSANPRDRLPEYRYTHASSEEKHDPWLKKKLRAEKPPGTSTTQPRSKFWADLKRSANVPRCISVRPVKWDCIIWSGKWWTTPLTRRWPISRTRST